MTADEIEIHKNHIDSFDRETMCRQWRFGKAGQYPWFDTANAELWEHWKKRFKELGGFSPEISKQIGW